MRRVSFEDVNCSIAQAVEIIGEWWTVLILRDALMGVTRFDEFQERLGISRSVLSARLDHLVVYGILDKTPYQDNPVRYDYVLTPKGRALWPVLQTLRDWADRWIVGKQNVPVVMIHEPCGKRTDAVLHCRHCGEPLRGSEMRFVRGPGADETTPLPVT